MKTHNPSEEQITRWMSEIRTLRRLRHERILLFMGVCFVSSDELWLVTSLCEMGSLYHLVHNLDVHLDVMTNLRFAIQISEGMEYLHARGVFHCDLKSASNV